MLKKSWFVLACFLSLSCLTLAQNKLSGLPPVIDRDLFFGNPEIAAAQLSPDGKYISFLKPWKDTRNIYVKGVDEPFSAARLLTSEAKRPIPGYFWTRDSKNILYVQDNDGDENFNIYAVDLPPSLPRAQMRRPRAISPDSRVCVLKSSICPKAIPTSFTWG